VGVAGTSSEDYLAGSQIVPSKMLLIFLWFMTYPL